MLLTASSVFVESMSRVISSVSWQCHTNNTCYRHPSIGVGSNIWWVVSGYLQNKRLETTYLSQLQKKNQRSVPQKQNFGLDSYAYVFELLSHSYLDLRHPEIIVKSTPASTALIRTLTLHNILSQKQTQTLTNHIQNPRLRLQLNFEHYSYARNLKSFF